eukprot:1294780-Rhodomonas_salina.3
MGHRYYQAPVSACRSRPPTWTTSSGMTPTRYYCSATAYAKSRLLPMPKCATFLRQTPLSPYAKLCYPATGALGGARD